MSTRIQPTEVIAYPPIHEYLTSYPHTHTHPPSLPHTHTHPACHTHTPTQLATHTHTCPYTPSLPYICLHTHTHTELGSTRTNLPSIVSGWLANMSAGTTNLVSSTTRVMFIVMVFVMVFVTGCSMSSWVVAPSSVIEAVRVGGRVGW